MLASVNLLFIRVRSILKELLPLFDPLFPILFPVDKLLLLSSHPFDVVDLVLLDLILKLFLIIVLSGFILLLVKAVKILLDLLDFSLKLIKSISEISPLLFDLVLLLSDAIQVLIFKLKFSLDLI